MRKDCRVGFTLIELLVVIAVIGILASMILVSLSDVRAKARDARRQSDIRQIALAMELSYSDSEEYPRLAVAPVKIPTDTGKYLDQVPKDPSSDSDYEWRDNTIGAGTDCNEQKYCIYAKMEIGGYFSASEKGTRELDTEPPSEAGKCCW